MFLEIFKISGDLLDRLSPGEMLPPDPADRFHNNHPHHPLSTRAGRLPELHPRGSFLDADPLPRARRITEIPYKTLHQWLQFQYFQSLDTKTLADGRYLVIVEIFDQDGNRLRPTGATGNGKDTAFSFLRLRGASGPDSTANVPFAALTHLFWFDNRPCYGKIEDLDVNGTPDTSVCQFLTGAASS